MASSTHLFLNLALFFFINLSLSTCNKLVLEQTPTPWLLTCLHATFTSIGCFVCLRRRIFKITRDLHPREHLTLLCFSCLFTINIAMSNVSLSHVSLALHQVARSTSPIFTVVIYGVWFRKVYSIPVYLAVTASSVGTGLVTYEDYSYTAAGLWLTFLGMALATIKTIATNRLMTGSLKLHPFEVLLRMCPLAAAQSLLVAYISGELGVASNVLRRGHLSRSTFDLMIFDGLLALGQNLSSFYTNKIAGALTIAVTANLKQLCTILLAIRIFETQIGLLSAFGIVIVLSSTMYHSWTVVKERSRDEEFLGTAVTYSDDISCEESGVKHR